MLICFSKQSRRELFALTVRPVFRHNEPHDRLTLARRQLSVGATPVLRQLLAQLRRGVEIQISPASRAVRRSTGLSLAGSLSCPFVVLSVVFFVESSSLSRVLLCVRCVLQLSCVF